MKIEKYLVTGVSGYLGSKIANQLVSQGQFVVGVDTVRNPHLPNAIEFHQLDIRNKEELARLFLNVTVVIHSAALVPLTRNYRDFESVNVLGSRTVAELALENNVEAFVQISSSAVFGKNSREKINGLTTLSPTEPYGRSKFGGEKEVAKVLSGTNVSLSIVRPRTIIGDGRGGIFDLFFSWIESNQPIFTIGPGNQPFQFVHVDDLISAIQVIANSRATGAFNVGTDRYSSLNDLFSSLVTHANSKSRVVHLPVAASILALTVLEKLNLSPLAPWHYKTFHLPFHFDTSPIQSLGWKPKFSNDEMFASSYDSYLAWSKDAVQDPGTSPHASRLNAGVLDLMRRFF